MPNLRTKTPPFARKLDAKKAGRNLKGAGGISRRTSKIMSEELPIITIIIDF